MTGLLWAVPITPIALPRRYSNGQASHCTLQYGVGKEQWEHLIGLSVTIGVLEECYDESIQAIAVVLPTDISCQNVNPHITVSWVNEAAPVLSNVMLASQHKKVPMDLEVIHCLVEWQEWGDKPNDRFKWGGRAYTPCPSCLRQGQRTMVRSLSGYCRKHKN